MSPDGDARWSFRPSRPENADALMPCARDAVLTVREAPTGSLHKMQCLACVMESKRLCRASGEVGGEALAQCVQDVARHVLNLLCEAGAVVVSLQPEFDQPSTVGDAIQKRSRAIEIFLGQPPYLRDGPQRQQNPARASILHKLSRDKGRRFSTLILQETQKLLLAGVRVGRRRLTVYISVVERDHQEHEGVYRLHVQIAGLPFRMVESGLRSGSADAIGKRAPGSHHPRSIKPGIDLFAVRASERLGEREQIHKTDATCQVFSLPRGTSATTQLPQQTRMQVCC